MSRYDTEARTSAGSSAATRTRATHAHGQHERWLLHPLTRHLGLHAKSVTLLDAVRRLRADYDAAALALFVAADAHRVSPSAAASAWELADGFGDELDAASQALAEHIDADIAAEQAARDRRNLQMLGTVGALGLLILGLTLFLQRSAAAAPGRPLSQLLAAVQHFTAGDLAARVGCAARMRWACSPRPSP